MKHNYTYKPDINKTDRFRRIAKLLIVITLVIGGIGECLGYRFSGTVIDQERNGINGAEVSVVKEGEEKPTVAFADKGGKYSLELESGKYTFSVSSFGFKDVSYTCDITSDMEDMNFMLQPDATVLQEVEVVSQQLKSYSNKDVMYLTEENRKHGLNALDAISSLPRFISSLNGTDLQNMSGTSVTILIEGRKASAVQLMNLTGNDIAKVEYYPTSPAKFRGYAGGPIVNVYLKRPKELKLNGNISSSNCVIFTNEASRAGLTLTNPNNLIMASYSNRCVNTSDIGNSSIYDYGDSSNSLVSRSGFYHTLSNNASINYQWNDAKNLFYMSFDYRGTRDKSGYDYDLTEIKPDKTVRGESFTEYYKHSDGFSVDIYYSRKFSRGQELSIDVLNSINKSALTNDNSRRVGEESDYTSFDAKTFSRNRIYSVIANAMFSSPLGGGEISASLYHSYRHLNQDFVNYFYTQNSNHNFAFENNSYASVGYFRSFNRFSADLTLNAYYDFRRQPDRSHFRDFQFMPRLNAGWNISDYITARYSFWIQSTSKSIGSDNENLTYEDVRVFRQNSMSMHAVYKYCNSLYFDFNIPSARLFLSPTISYYHSRHPYMETATQIGDNFIIRNTEVPFINDVAFSLVARYTPASWLYLIGIYNCDYSAYNLPMRKMRKTANRFQLRAGGSIGKIQYEAGMSTPKNSYDGVTRWHEDWSFNASVYWTSGSWYAGISYMFQGLDTWFEDDYGQLRKYSKMHNRFNQKNLSISVGYNFEVGRLTRRSNAAKRLQNVESDFGI